MADHDELCPATIADGRWRARCECALIARVRADENMKVCRCGCMERDAHAEAVAAKLVEVICERDERVGYWHRRWDFAQGQMDAMGASLLAARAEVERLRSPEWEAEVRADERERIVAELEGPARESEAMYAHAEQVAAKLVEVVCEDAVTADQYVYVIASLKRERDAARAQSTAAQAEARVAESEVRRISAEVAALTDALDIAKDERYAARVEQARAAQRLRDLRAKVLMLEHDDSCSEIRQEAPCDCLRGSVLALIEEVDRG